MKSNNSHIFSIPSCGQMLEIHTILTSMKHQIPSTGNLELSTDTDTRIIDPAPLWHQYTELEMLGTLTGPDGAYIHYLPR